MDLGRTEAEERSARGEATREVNAISEVRLDDETPR